MDSVKSGGVLPVSLVGILAFVEGSAVMSLELLAGRHLTPWFGTSHYVWSAILGVTMTALLVGYFLGGRAVEKTGNPLVLVALLILCASSSIITLPLLSDVLIVRLLDQGLILALLQVLGVLVLPGLILLGMVPPLLIGAKTGEERPLAGQYSGLVFALSTLGGITTCMVLGFLLISWLGASVPAILLGITFCLPGLILLRILGRRLLFFFCLVVISCLTILCFGQTQLDKSVLYCSEGLMGQIKVVDLPKDPQGRQLRALVVNNTMQTVIDTGDPDYSFWPYGRLVASIAATYPDGSSTLLLGVGGGSIAHLLNKQGCSQSLVEIDARLVQVARDWFHLPQNLNITVDDARHVVRTSRTTFDLIICDAFRGESAPEHVLTLEGFREMGAILNPGGSILVNFYGYADGPAGELAWSIVRTAMAAGFEAQVLATPGTPDERNLLIRIWATASDLAKPRIWIDGSGEELGFELDENLSGSNILLTDDKPHSILFSAASMQWRRLYTRYFRSIGQVSTTD